MKNQRKIYEALLVGETLISSAKGEKVKLNNEDRLVWADSGERSHSSFVEPEKWSIYKEPKWYENIPEGGVLCWVSGNIHVITEYEKLNEYGFKITKSHWCKNPKPLTKQEIQVFMDNAPNVSPKKTVCDHDLVPNKADEPEYYKCTKCNHVQGYK